MFCIVGVLGRWVDVLYVVCWYMFILCVEYGGYYLGYIMCGGYRAVVYCVVYSLCIGL